MTLQIDEMIAQADVEGDGHVNYEGETTFSCAKLSNKRQKQTPPDLYCCSLSPFGIAGFVRRMMEK